MSPEQKVTALSPAPQRHQQGIGSGAEVGTIGGIVSAVAMALVGAVTSYISYQKKKLCFGIQREEPPGLKLSLTLSQNVIRGALSD
ncbi:unnamed protein product [Boreogadus saida]